MPKTDRFRALYVLKYLWEHTDEEHPVTLVQIQNHLSQLGIEAIPKTILRSICFQFHAKRILLDSDTQLL